MEQEEHSTIVNFLNNGIYPAAASRTSKMELKFKRKASFVSQSQKLYKIASKQYAKMFLFIKIKIGYQIIMHFSFKMPTKDC